MQVGPCAPRGRRGEGADGGGAARLLRPMHGARRAGAQAGGEPCLLARREGGGGRGGGLRLEQARGKVVTSGGAQTVLYSHTSSIKVISRADGGEKARSVLFVWISPERAQVCTKLYGKKL